MSIEAILILPQLKSSPRGVWTTANPDDQIGLFKLHPETKSICLRVCNLLPHQVVRWRVCIHISYVVRDKGKGSKSATKESGYSLAVCLFMRKTPLRKTKQTKNLGHPTKILVCYSFFFVFFWEVLSFTEEIYRSCCDFMMSSVKITVTKTCFNHTTLYTHLFAALYIHSFTYIFFQVLCLFVKGTFMQLYISNTHFN